MKISNKAISQLVQYVNGEEHAPYRSGTQLLKLFNEYGGYDYRVSEGLPMRPNSNMKYSRKDFTEQKMTEMNNSDGLRRLLEAVLNQSESPEAIQEIKGLLSREGYAVDNVEDQYVITGGVIDRTKPVINEAHFRGIEKQVLDALNEAKVSIKVAMAWFTNDKIKDKLLEKQNDGVEVDLVIHDDGVNGKHGVDLSGLPHTYVRGSRGGIMHNKFCVVDNQVVLQGSYNWTTSAETRNDETVNVLRDLDSATQYSIEFRNLKDNSKTKK